MRNFLSIRIGSIRIASEPNSFVKKMAKAVARIIWFSYRLSVCPRKYHTINHSMIKKSSMPWKKTSGIFTT